MIMWSLIQLLTSFAHRRNMFPNTNQDVPNIKCDTVPRYASRALACGTATIRGVIKCTFKVRLKQHSVKVEIQDTVNIYLTK